MKESEFTTIKVSKSLAATLNAEHLKKGSYNTTIDALVKESERVIDSEAAEMLKKAAGTDDLSAAIKSHILDEQREAVTELSPLAKETFRAVRVVSSYEKAIALATTFDAVKSAGNLTEQLLSIVLVQQHKINELEERLK